MKRLLATLALLLPLAGCGVFQPAPVHSKASTGTSAVATVRTIIDESYATLIALNRTISQNLDDRIWTPEQARPYLEKSADYRKQTDRARELLRLGDPFAAETQAKAVRELILRLHREVATKARSSP